MAHDGAGHYSAKHPEGTEPDPRITKAVKGKMKNGRITCAAAHIISGDLGVSPTDVGLNMDLLECRLTKCQLGLFGYGPEKKLVKPADTLSPDLEEAIQSSIEDGRISCAATWNIADKLGISKQNMANACEKQGVKISPCQLGAF